eukprot:TRINITY_DN4817_c0_g1_i1.p2 TRINITY_DN4817_c0_g1~~TRINITY_DN4817_c0_g1_i1.p2  ORF type:complete len:149 (+),score=28.90 TRINITY_DN4817_c0_g1_i1:63-509(+)
MLLFRTFAKASRSGALSANVLTRWPVMGYKTLADEIVISQAAIRKIEERTKNLKQSFLRVGVEGGSGCSGYRYVFNLDHQLNEDDLVFKKDERVLLAVDELSLGLIKGSQIDYEDKMIRAAFVVNSNPNAEKSCSCKVSFSPKDGLLT